MKNLEIAKIFYEIADILEIQGIDFKPRAYRKAAKNIESMPQDIEELHKKNKLEEIPGVGEHIAKKIEEIIETGKLKYLEKIRKQVPGHLNELLKVQSIGPKKAKQLHDKLGVTTLKDLEDAAKSGKIRKLDGFGETSELDILKGIEIYKKGKERIPLGFALPIARELEHILTQLKDTSKVLVAGSLRRRKSTIGDLDVLVASKQPEKIMDFVTAMKNVQRVLSRGTTKSSVILENGIQVDLRVVHDSDFGAASQYFTGSKEHGIKTRIIANQLGYKLSEYGLFNKNNKKVAGETEEEIYKKLGMQCPEPELREDRGEIELAQKNRLPKIIPYNAVKGDFHVHSNYSDGSASIEEVAKECIRLGYEYVCIADHSKSTRIGNGLTEERLLKKCKEIDQINKKLKKIRILRGAEVDILANGELDYDNKILKQLDIVIIAVHSKFKMPKEEMTNRILKAMDNTYVNILAHPTGVYYGMREAYEIDFPRIFEKAAEKNICLEINCSAPRMDLSDINIKAAIDNNVKLAIGTDTHALEQLKTMEIGVAQARRGWATKKDILNTRTLKELGKYFNKIII
ncbi:DNA polymerase/3'-5' exonuclease PolX [Candidatus Woesearchaeota archaeon]|nr:DNA polymerase/3'-5' exonuclease PolX [Candidatus Woesearchaeota archaeon]